VLRVVTKEAVQSHLDLNSRAPAQRNLSVLAKDGKWSHLRAGLCRFSAGSTLLDVCGCSFDLRHPRISGSCPEQPTGPRNYHTPLSSSWMPRRVSSPGAGFRSVGGQRSIFDRVQRGLRLGCAMAPLHSILGSLGPAICGPRPIPSCDAALHQALATTGHQLGAPLQPGEPVGGTGDEGGLAQRWRWLRLSSTPAPEAACRVLRLSACLQLARVAVKFGKASLPRPPPTLFSGQGRLRVRCHVRRACRIPPACPRAPRQTPSPPRYKILEALKSSLAENPGETRAGVILESVVGRFAGFIVPNRALEACAILHPRPTAAPASTFDEGDDRLPHRLRRRPGQFGVTREHFTTL